MKEGGGESRRGGDGVRDSPVGVPEADEQRLTQELGEAEALALASDQARSSLYCFTAAATSNSAESR